MQTRETVLGIDVGSSSCKVGVFDLRGESWRVVSIPAGAPTASDRPGEREYDPELWWDAVCAGTRKLLAETGIVPAAIRAVGLTGQIGTHLVVDEGGVPLMPAISWQDDRSAQDAALLSARLPAAELDELTGVHLPPNGAWPIPRFLWLKRRHAELFGRPFTLVQPKDFIGFRLTGTLGTDVLSLRGIVHPERKTVSTKISQDILGVPDIMEHLPPIEDFRSILGRLTADAAAATGLARGTPVVVGCGDFHAALLGAGLTDDSYAFNITGTSEHVGVYRRSGDPGKPELRLGRYPSVVDGWDVRYGVTSAGGASVDWFLRTFFSEEAPRNITGLVQETLALADSSRGLVFLPYLNGERAPIWDEKARGVFFGLSSEHTLAHMLRSVLEGVAFSLEQCLELIVADTAERPPVRVTGASSRDRIWNQMKADVFRAPVQSMRCVEATCIGAGIVAAVGSGLFASLGEGISEMTAIESEFVPDASKVDYYGDLFGVYRGLYPALKGQFDLLARTQEGR